MIDANFFSPEQREIFRNAFDAFDENRTEHVSTDLLGKLIRAVGYNPLPEEVEDMVEDIGAPTFDFEALLYLLYRHAREADPVGELIDAFKVFDKGACGRLKTTTVRQILHSLKQPFTEDQINELLSDLETIDAKTDTLEYEELVKKMISF
jgi:Ca2+-binding EF-hand superfamily protein